MTAPTRTYQRDTESDSLLETVAIDEEGKDSFWSSGRAHVAGAAVVVGAMILGVFAFTTDRFYTQQQVSPMRSSHIFGDVQIASRTAPLFLDTSVTSKDGGYIAGVLQKYAPYMQKADISASSLSIGDRAKGDPDYWITYAMSTGSTCDSGSVISMAGIAGHQCTAYQSASVMAVCVSGTAYMVTFPSGDSLCSNLQDADVQTLGPYDNCFTTDWGSVYAKCQSPQLSMLSGYDVQTVYTANSTYDAQTWCRLDSSLSYSGTLFEAFPINKCILGMTNISDPGAFVTTSSLMFGYKVRFEPFENTKHPPLSQRLLSPTTFGHKDTIFTPTYTNYPSDQKCGVNNPKLATSNLQVDCTVFPGQSSPTYSKWYYRV